MPEAPDAESDAAPAGSRSRTLPFQSAEQREELPLSPPHSRRGCLGAATGVAAAAAVSSPNGLAAVTRASRGTGDDRLHVPEGEPMVLRSTGRINLDFVHVKGEIGSVTTTGGLAFKIPGRAGDGPIVGAGQHTESEVGAASFHPTRYAAHDGAQAAPRDAASLYETPT